MKRPIMLVSASFLLGISGAGPVYAQDSEVSDSSESESPMVMENIVVTGRKRDETLQDIPVSASVVTNTLIEDAGITNLYDMFELIPGLHYDEGAESDRLAALPSIRGIQSNDIASNRTKVSAFVDGMPVLGSQGSIGFNGFEQVEVYRGPQSAAFGRSTFAGAINYVTRDPGDEFAADVSINVSDYGTRILSGNIDVPVSDTFGFMVSAQIEDSGSPSEYHATGNAGERTVDGVAINAGQSDGTEFGSRSGDNISAKFVFEPSDKFKASFLLNHVETADQRTPELYLTESARNACFDGDGLVASQGMTSIYYVGTYDCDWDSFRAIYAQHDDEQWLRDNPALLASVVAAAEANGATDNAYGLGLTVEEQALLVAQGYSIPLDERGTLSERDRGTVQLDYLFDSGHAVQFSYMHGEESSQRASDGSVYSYDPDNVGIFEDGVENSFGAAPGTGVNYNAATGFWAMNSGMGAPRVIAASETELEEDYAELRWVSPAEDRLRFVVGASLYEYSFLEERYGNDMRDGGLLVMGYGAELNGIVSEWSTLTNTDFMADNGVIGEETTNTAAYFNVNYDLTDKLTLSAEGRFQSDKVSSTNADSGLSRSITTDAFVPRFSATYAVDDNTSFYVQWSQGVNPAGINNDALDLDVIETVENGVANGLIAYDASLVSDDDADGILDIYNPADGLLYTDSSYTTLLTGETYRAEFEGTDSFISYREEKLTNIEFGFKGTLLDGALSYAGAIFMMDWQDQLQNGSIDIGSPCANAANAFDPNIGACSYEDVDYFYVDTTAGTTPNVGLNFGDVITKGLELEGTYRISPEWSVRAQASYLDAKYEDYCDIALYSSADFSNNTAYLEGLGLTVVEPGSSDTLQSTCYDTSGNEVAGQPKISGSISPSFMTDIAGMQFSARLDIRYEGEQWVESGNFSKYGGVATGNLSFGLSSDSWSATLYVNNITDENQPLRISSGGDDTDVIGLIDVSTPDELVDAFGLGDVRVDGATTWDLSRDNYRFTPRTPRTVGFRASYRF